MNTFFQPTENCQMTDCLAQGLHPQPHVKPFPFVHAPKLLNPSRKLPSPLCR